jgi:hypothetical protein
MIRTQLRTEQVEYIPEHLAVGVLYVSERYSTAVHKCCCGCGEEVVTPLTPTDWRLRLDRGLPTLRPSVGNWSFPCRSHYWITDGRVSWSTDMSQARIQSLRNKDKNFKAAYFASRNRIGPGPNLILRALYALRDAISSWINGRK